MNNTVHFLGRFPIEAMKTFFEQADVLLVSLKDEMIFNLTVPAKLQAYMCAKKPILGMLNGEGAEIINEAKCGFSVDAGNFEGLAKIILEMQKMNIEDRLQLGSNGFSFYQENFILKKCIDNLEMILMTTTK